MQPECISQRASSGRLNCSCSRSRDLTAINPVVPEMMKIAALAVSTAPGGNMSFAFSKFSTKFRKLILKRQSFPWLWETTIKTKKYNEWYISFYAESKKEVGIINATFNMIFKYKGQLLTGTVKGDEAFIFSGHFFDRYKERFFKIHKENRLITDKDIMKVFFIFNSNCWFCDKEKEDNIRGFCYDGILLGDWFGGEGGIVKTFISRQEMKINQFAEYFEIFKMWIIEDMFKARKGFELEKELIKYIPDTTSVH